VVEDDRDIRESITEVLEDEGYRVTSAQDGECALEYLKSPKPHPHLILLDLMMPRMNGFQFREEQLKDPKTASIPVAVFTADGNAQFKADKLNAAGYVRKPLDINTLLDLISRVLSSTHHP